MARLPRLDLPNVPQLIVQRARDRQLSFVADEDYRSYCSDLADAAALCGCAIHAYVLMTHHVHLLVTGSERGAVSRMMQRLGRRYVRGFNDRHRRSGNLWEGRFKSSLIDSTRYLLTCHRYIELDPVRAAMVASSAKYPWSSYRHNAFGKSDPLVTPHPLYLQLGPSSTTRRAAYRALFAAPLGDDEVADIRAHLQQQKVLGTPTFQAEVEALLARNVSVRPRGRPRQDED